MGKIEDAIIAAVEEETGVHVVFPSSEPNEV